MYRINKILISIVILFLLQPLSVSAQEKIDLYFFYGDGCPHCAKEEKFLDQLEAENKNIKVYRYEVWHNRDNQKLLSEVARDLNLDVAGVPVLIVGDETIVGYFSDETTGEKIKSLVRGYTLNGCEDIVAPILRNVAGGSVCEHGCDAGDLECLHDCGCEADFITAGEVPETIPIPIFGEVDTKKLSLPLLTLVLGGVDGFNPCAMWVLLFLISLLLGMKDRKRMWILGSVFILTSGAVYFLFLAAWLNLFLFLGFVLWIRIAVGLVALVSGSLHLRSWWNNREGCEVIDDGKRKRIFNRVKGIITEKSFLLALVGLIILAATVNLIELVCSAGLPAVYTQVLALAHLPTWQYYAYLLFYIFIYMLDDMLIFIIAMTTLKMKAVESKYTRYAGLIGGIAMVIIGILLLFKPGWIMFG